MTFTTVDLDELEKKFCDRHMSWDEKLEAFQELENQLPSIIMELRELRKLKEVVDSEVSTVEYDLELVTPSSLLRKGGQQAGTPRLAGVPPGTLHYIREVTKVLRYALGTLVNVNVVK